VDKVGGGFGEPQLGDCYRSNSMSNANNDNPNRLPANAKRGIPSAPGKDIPPEAMAKLGNLFKSRPQQYMPVLKSLETIDIEQRLMTLTIDGDVTVECLVIPLQELIFKEWRQMSGSTLQPQNERKDESE
jgi:hypothetical protein